MTVQKLNNGCAVALGNFDGIHIGHKAVLDETARFAGKGLTPTVMLFDEHSLKNMTGEAPPMLIAEKERINRLTSKGFDYKKISFQKIKGYTPEEFVKEILIGEFNAQAVVCGFNYRFGTGASGNAQTLCELCKKYSIECVIVDEIELDGVGVSSTAIRNAVQAGDIGLVNKMLGRPFGFSSTVIDGDKRGRTWGLPTVNQKLPEGLVVPKFGVYEARVTVDGKRYKGVTNIGSRPTVGTDMVLSETHIIDFNESVYGKNVDIRLLRFLRPEQKFSSFDELIAQIKSDVLKVKGGE